MNLKQKVVLFIATGAYTGYIPFAPGTFGSLFALLPCFFLSRIGVRASLLWIVVLIAVAVWSAHVAERIINRKDPGCIVIDEVAGMVITLLGIPFHPFNVIAAFFIFRILDILKPYPIGYLEKRVPGGAGIVVDDVVAGIMGNIILRVILLLF